MKVKVVMPFKDKATKKTHNVGSIIDLDAKRVAEIQKAGRFVVPVMDEKAVEESK